jgi:DNA helicase-2/ATP-dependent DNA helicase PcrA
MWDDDLEGPHRQIAGSDHPRIGVLAGPGTGKTAYGLMRRVVRLLETGVDGRRILLLSFTRVAAADLRDKVATLDSPGVEYVRATTLHSYCFGLLRRDAVLDVTGRVPRILLDHEVDLTLRDIGGDFGNIHERRRQLEAFVAGWARGQDDHPGIATEDVERAFEHAIMRWLREHRSMLIGEVVPEAYRYLSNNPAAEEFAAFEHIIVDEYQDLNVLEQRLLDVLAQKASLCIAGDDDQSIYSVRYANPDGIQAYLAREDVEPHAIAVCGRCPANILALANALIRHAPGRHKPDLQPRKPDSVGASAIVQWPNVETEIEGVVAAIAQDVGSGRREAGDVLILTNWRRIGERIRARLVELEIPARSFFTEEELASDVGREALAVLRLVVNDDDAPALRVLLGLGDAAGRTDAYQRLLSVARERSETPKRVLERLEAGENLPLRVPALLKRYARAIGTASRLRDFELPDLVDELLPDDRPEIADLRAVALDALAVSQNADELLRVVVEAITQDAVPQSPDFVRVMSLHKSKGLTSPSVFVVGAVLGVLPTIRSDEPSAVAAATDEGRRLFYVAVTRAAEELVISGSIAMDLADANARGVIYDRRTIRRVGDRYIVRTIMSPFVSELGPSAPNPVTGEAWLTSR